MPTKGGSNCNCDAQNGGKKAQKAKKAKGAKKPTEYNLFMKKEIQRVKKMILLLITEMLLHKLLIIGVKIKNKFIFINFLYL